MQTPYKPPTFKATAFHCAFCKAYAAHDWLPLENVLGSSQNFYPKSHEWYMSACSHCGGVAVWHGKSMIYPEANTAPMAHTDIPDSMKDDFEEARSVLQRSPRSAAALLRLCLQKLCAELGEQGNDINADIASLVRKGLPVEVQQALDIVRVVGNEQVHAGELDLRDSPEIAVELFKLINFIIEDQITRPKSVRSLYARLPTNKLEGIEQRDRKQLSRG